MSNLKKRLDDLSPQQRKQLLEKLRAQSKPKQKNTTKKADEIVAVDRSTFLPLSFAQQRLWFLDQLEDQQSSQYNEFNVIRIKGKLDLALLERCLQSMVQRHEILRTCFPAKQGKAEQRIVEDCQVQLLQSSVAQLIAKQQTVAIEKIIADESATAFHLDVVPLFRFRLVQLDEQNQLFLSTMHHIICDYWSGQLFQRELAQLYTAFSNNKAFFLPPLKIQYADFATWQHRCLIADKQSKQLLYWQKQLANAPELLELPSDYARPRVQSFKGQQIRTVLDAELLNGLKKITQQSGATLFMTLLAVFAILLQRYSRQDDILIGSALAGRNRQSLESLLGFFVNTLVFRVDFSQKLTLQALFDQVKKMALAAYDHQDIAFEKIVEALQPRRSLSHSPLFQVMFVLQNAVAKTVQLPELEMSSFEHETGSTKFDLSLEIVEGEQTLECIWNYATDLFTVDSIQSMAAHFQQLLKTIVAEPNQWVHGLSLRTVEDEQRLRSWNQTQRPYPKNKTLMDLFESQVLQHPQRVALIDDDVSLSYQQLNHRVNQLAHYLLACKNEQGNALIQQQSLIAISVERSIEMVVALFAILKTGAAYVPIDPDYPLERVRYILEDSAAVLLLTQGHLKQRLSLATRQHNVLLCVDELFISGKMVQQPTNNPAVQRDAQQLAYVIYTSGSTGQPKGAMNQHDGVVNRILWMQEHYQLNSQDRILQKTPFSFDVSVWEFFLPLSTGACLIMAQTEGHKDPHYLLDIIDKYAISTLHFVPSMLHVFLQVFSSANHLQACHALKRVICSGEALSSDLQQRFFDIFSDNTVELHNLYGPTEAAIDVSYWQCQAEQQSSNVPIGKPVANTRLYVLDAHDQCLPAGIPGELCIAGVQVGRGYLNLPKLSTEKFTSVDILGKPQRIYRTGDLARWLPNGNLQYLGRLDHQVKLRGFRIELGEIEAGLMQHTQVQEAVVLLRESDQRLIAYYVNHDEVSTEHITADLRQVLQQQLPDYMIPSYFVSLEVMPLNANGKTDRSALKHIKVVEENHQQCFINARNDDERLLQTIWQRVLQRKQTIGIEDNFFELGGHSLLATQVIARIREDFSIEIAVRQLFETPTIAALAAYIQTQDLNHQSVVPHALVREEQEEPAFPLSFAQERLWFLDQLEGQNAVYNIPVAIKLQGVLNRDALQYSFDQMIQRHEILRTVFINTNKNNDHNDNDNVQQVIKAPFSLALPCVDLTSLSVKAQKNRVNEELQALARRPFDLSRLALWRCLLLTLEKDVHVLAIVWHHSIFDAWSGERFISEFTVFYQAFCENSQPNLAEMPLQYADYSVWQHRYLSGAFKQQQLAYWQQQLADAPTLLTLATDYPRPLKLRFRGDVVRLTLSESLTQSLQGLAQQQNSTLFMLLLSVYAVLLQRYSGQDDVVIGSPIANRQHQNVEGLIGFLVNTLALRVDLSNTPRFSALLEHVKQSCLQAYQHQDVPFEQVVEALQPERNPSHTPVYQVMFAWQDALGQQQSLALKGLDISGIEVNTATARCDLTLLMSQQEGRLQAYFEYNSDLFAAKTIESMSQHFQTLLQGVVANPQQKVSLLPLLSQQEWQTQFIDWNRTQSDYPKRSIDSIFLQQVALYPNKTAISFGEQQLSYAELSQRSQHLAQHLQAMGVEPNDLLGLATERSLEMIVALLAILRVGGVYVSLDMTLADQQIDFIIADAGIHTVLTQQHYLERFEAKDLYTINLDTLAKQSTSHSLTKPIWQAPTLSGENLAYISYTSGTTGKPKGVCIRHKSVVRLVKNTHFMQFDAEQVFLQFASLAFDASTLEIWGALLNGGRLAIMPAKMPSLATLGQVIKEQYVTSLWLTAGLFNLMVDEHLDDLKSVRQLLAGGDVLSVPHVKKALAALPHCQLINGYGPTENTTFTCCYLIVEAEIQDSIPIGYPIANTQVYVLDAQRQALPIGVSGELYIAGDGLAAGYLNAPELTAEKFIQHRFVDTFGNRQTQRLYKTGDRVRYRQGGLLEFLGRLDNQVKIRGFRVEPSQTEALLLQHPFVQEACVIVQESTQGDKRLLAYVTLKEVAPQSLDNNALLSFLAKQLPVYQQPDFISVLPHLPLNVNGKIDRKALPLPEYSVNEKAYQAPQTPEQEILLGLWVALFHLTTEQAQQLSIYDDFFERGGHSLLATQLVSQIRRVFAVEMPLRDVFEQPTIEALAQNIQQSLHKQNKASQSQALEQGIKPVSFHSDHLPLSFAQERLWFLNQLEPENPFYNVPLILSFKGQLNIEALEQSVEAIIQRHSVLRTRFINRDGKPEQVIHAHLLQQPLFKQAKALLEQIDHLAFQEAQLPFDLAQDDLFRATLLTIDAQHHVLLVTLHHCVADGWSLGILVDELLVTYPAFLQQKIPVFEPLAIQYADFSHWQRQWLSGETLDRQLAYWKQQLSGVSPVLQLPTDYLRPTTQSFRGNSQQLIIDASLTLGLQTLSQQCGTTLFMTLLSAFSVLLYRYSDQDDMVIGTPIANRNRAEIEPLIGFFVNTLALRIDLSASPDFLTLQQRVREVALDAYAHQDLPFEKLVNELNIERDLSRNPLFQVMFSMQNMPLKDLHLPEVAVESLDLPHTAALFDLVLDIWPTDEGMIAVLQYSTDLFHADTIAAMLKHYQALLQQIVVTPEQSIEYFSLLTQEEKRKLLALGQGEKRCYPVKQTLHDLFEAQVAQSPQRIAVQHNQQQISYGALNQRANQIASRLIQLGAKKGQCIGLLEARGIELVAAILGILKTGCAFLPIDPAYPLDRVQYMIENSQTPILISRVDLLVQFGVKKRVSCLDILDLEDPHLANESKLNPSQQTQASDWAYMLYTSGSTGLPKGTIVRHNGAINHLYAEFEALNFHSDSAFLQSAPSSSDISVWQLLGALLIGGRTVIVDFETVCDPAELFAVIQQQQISLIELVPVVLQALLDYVTTLSAKKRVVPALEWAMVTGEAVSVALVNQWLTHYPQIKLVNAYGPTEAADDICQAVFDTLLPETQINVPIGKPLANLSLMVLDKHQQLRPCHVPGEICVSGIGVGAGYWQNTEKTQQQFVDNPFVNSYGEVLYRTGDLGRWLSDGSLEFLGRIDQQVKIRGFRIELGEIEGVLAQHPTLKEAVVLEHLSQSNEKQLVAYLQADQHAKQQLVQQDNLHVEQVDLWKELHEDSYSDSPSHEDLSFNIVGWDSNYTGQQLPDEDMQEYVQHTIEAILALKPQRILEIGCGTGLLMYRLVPACQEYLGTDLSSVALKRLEDSKALLAIDGLAKARFEVRVADDFSGLKTQYFDTVVINSVLQYFPDTDYLVNVIAGCIDLLKNNGRIFIGDVRHYALQESYHASVQAYKANENMDALSLRQQIQQQMQQDQELYLDPAFFIALKQQHPQIQQVEIRPKRGLIHNEMTRFRYDVVLHLGEPLASASILGNYLKNYPDHLIEGGRASAVLETIQSFCQQNNPQYLLFKQVVNARIADEKGLMHWLQQASDEKVTEWQRHKAEQITSSAAIDPEDFWQLELALPYHVTIQMDLADNPYCYDVLLQAKTNHDAVSQIIPPLIPLRIQPNFPWLKHKAKAWHEYANDPLQEKFNRQIVAEARQSVKDKLPNYMMPSSFMVLDVFPVLPNGKINRQALPEPDVQAEQLREAYLPASTKIQQVLVGIWEAILALEKISIQDNFFDLGGHSLKATQVVSQIHQQLDIEVTLREIFSHTTIAELAELIEHREHSGYEWIRPVPQAEHYALSHAQRRLWVLAQIEPNSAAYHMSESLLLTGKLDLNAFQRAYSDLLQRHEILRTQFIQVNDEARQRIVENHQSSIEQIEQIDPLDLVDSEGSDESIKTMATAYLNQPFDWQKSGLIRIALLPLSTEKTLLLFSMHHIISDGWSMDILVKDFLQCYQAAKTGKPPALVPLTIQYKDYAAWQNQLLLETSTLSHQQYWLDTLSGDLPVLDLPADFTRPAVKSYRGRRYSMSLPLPLSKALETLAQQQQVSLFMMLLALVKVLFYRYTQQQDMIIGSPVAGRDHADLENQIGFYINTLVLRSQLDSKQCFSDYLQQIKQITLAGYDHQIYPFDRLVHDLKIPRDVSRTPLFDVMVVLQNIEEQAFVLDDMQIDAFPLEEQASQFDMTLSFSPPTEATGLVLTLWYNCDLFLAERIERLTQHFQTLVKSVVKQPTQTIGYLPILAKEEQQQLATFQQPEVQRNKSEQLEQFERLEQPSHLVEWFETQVKKMPNATALCFEAQHLCYAELNQRANQLAHHLLAQGIRSQMHVGLCMERCLEMVISVLAILKAGATYVPLDPHYPQQRLFFMLHDADIKHVVTNNGLWQTLAEKQEKRSDDFVSCLDVGQQAALIAQQSEQNLERFIDPQQVAYIIYTSGSTGQPKGVQVTQANVVRLFRSTEAWYHFNADDVWTLFHSYAFDFSVWEIWGALLYGGRLVIVPYWVSRSPEDFYALLLNEQVTVLNQTPSAFQQLIPVDALSKDNSKRKALALRSVIFGGEALDIASLQPWFERHGDQKPQLVNMYGITETTVHVTYRPLSMRDLAQNASLIGQAIPDLLLRVVDQQGELMPIGVAGELYVGGEGVTLGYLNRPDLNQQRFVIDPHSRQRFYKTGDLVRYLSNGDLEYLGRIDHQVKIRGFRIEVGEIEAVLSSHEHIQQCKVVTKESKNTKQLVAYFIAKTATVLSEDHMPSLRSQALHQYLQQTLPDYMIPNAFVAVLSFPTTPSGKVDTKALLQQQPVISQRETDDDYVAPSNSMEKLLSEIWQELLHQTVISIEANFFELGAHSLLIIQAQRQLVERLQRDIPIVQLFKYPSIRLLANYLNTLMTEVEETLVKDKTNAQSHVQSRVQKRLVARKRRQRKKTRH